MSSRRSLSCSTFNESDETASAVVTSMTKGVGAPGVNWGGTPTVTYNALDAADVVLPVGSIPTMTELLAAGDRPLTC